MNQLKFSIIVPVYNSEKYIRKTLSSVLSQTYKNFEIIIIDDASTDDSFAVCSEFVSKNDQIKLLKNNVNKGQSYSRNRGLDHANGDWILFLDSDDYYNDNKFLEKLEAVCSNCDFVSFGFTIYSVLEQKVQEIRCNELSSLNNCNNLEEQIILIREYTTFRYSPVVRCYNKQFLTLNKIKFDTKLRSCEDIEWFYQLLINNPKIKGIDSADYYYCKKNERETLTFNHIKEVDSVSAILISAKLIYNSSNKEEYKTLLYSTLVRKLLALSIDIKTYCTKEEQKFIYKRLRKVKFLYKYGYNKKTKLLCLIMRAMGNNIGSSVVYRLYKVFKAK